MAPPPDPEPGPEDGAARRRWLPGTIGGACYLGILALTLTGLVIAAISDWRMGIRLISGTLGVAALLRLVLPEREAGMLAVRHRLLDVAVLLVLGGTLFALAATIPDQPV